MSPSGWSLFDPPPPLRRACERCGKPVVVELVGESAPAVCDVCAAYVNREQGKRALEGNPYETAFKLEISLDEDWHD